MPVYLYHEDTTMRSNFEAIMPFAVTLIGVIMLLDTTLPNYPYDHARMAHAAQGIARVIETMAAPRPA